MITICDDLRKSILQAAIQGKLTKQLPEDGNAEDLYKQIQAEKQKLIKEEKIKKEKPLPEIKEDEIPFDIPENWKWVRLENLGLSFADGPFGSNLKKEHYTNNPEVRIIQLSNIGEYGWKDENVKFTTYKHLETIQRSEVEAGNIVIAKMMPAGRAIIVPDLGIKFVLSSDAVKVVPSKCINVKYLLYSINSNVFKSQIYEEVQGITRIRTSLTKLKGYLLPLPPLAEQRRIVAKVDELLAKVDEMEMTEKAITTLYDEFPGDMKASLLQAAIQGKLTEQLPEDGNAEDLYKEIQSEKQRLIKEGKIKKDKNESYIFRRDNSHYEKLGDSERCIDDELPFEIPKNWKWVHIPDVTFFQEGPGILAVDFRKSGVPLIRISGLQGPVVTLDGCNYLDPEIVNQKWNHFRLCKGDIVISTSASMDKMAEVTEDADGAIPYTGQIRFKMYNGLDKKYFVYFIETPFYMHQIEEQAEGSAIKHYGPSHLRKMLIPLPPLAEQKRIVDILNKLLSICNELNS